MKKAIGRIVPFLLVLCLFTGVLASCATKLNGTYTNKSGLIEQSFTFDEDKVKMSAFGIDVEGTYVIEDDKITITYTLFNISTSWEKDFKKDGNSIFIDGTEFIKE